jgi:hypothetical protein
MQKSLDNMLLKVFFGSDHVRTNASGVSWVDRKSAKEPEGTYTDGTGHYGQPGYATIRKETVVEYTIPASALEIEGEYNVVEDQKALVVRK